MWAKDDVRIIVFPINAPIFVQFLDAGRVRIGLDPSIAGVRPELERKRS